MPDLRRDVRVFVRILGLENYVLEVRKGRGPEWGEVKKEFVL